MKRVFDHIRDHLWERVEPRRLPPLAELRKTQWSEEFENLMRNRLIMGRFRYGGDIPSGEGMSGAKYADSGLKRLQAYLKDGNKEHLVDAANCCLLEYHWPSVKGAHFSPTDDGPIHVEHIEY